MSTPNNVDVKKSHIVVILILLVVEAGVIKIDDARRMLTYYMRLET
jgi:hypothetical protein